MNVRETIDTIEAKVGLLACQQAKEDRAATRRDIEFHIDEIRDALGLADDSPGCCGCGCEQLRRCLDCGGDYCDVCGSECGDDFLCDICQEEREQSADDAQDGLDAPSNTGTIHVFRPGPDQVAIMRSPFSESGNDGGHALLDEYEQDGSAVGGWDADAVKKVDPSTRLFGAVGNR